MPLLIHFAYSLSVVTARISGWRFIMPVDWVAQIYYSIGLIQLIWMLAAVVWNRVAVTEETATETRPLFFHRKTYLAIAGFLLVGLSLPVMELALPQILTTTFMFAGLSRTQSLSHPYKPLLRARVGAML